MSAQANIYNFRILLLWQGIVILLIGCLVGGLLCYALLKLLPREGWFPVREIGTLLLVAAIFATYRFGGKWLTVPVTFIVRRDNLEISGVSPRRQWLQPSDQLIFWNEIAEWQIEPAHANAHTLSPPTFKIKLTDGRKLYLMIAGDLPAYAAFLVQFEQKLRETHEKNPALGRIRRNPEFARSAGAFWFMTIVAALVLLGGTWLFFWPPAGTDDFTSGEFYLGVWIWSLFVFLLGWLARRKGKKEAKKTSNPRI